MQKNSTNEAVLNALAIIVRKHITTYFACLSVVFFQPVISQGKQLYDSRLVKVSLSKFDYLSDIGIVAVSSTSSVLIINNANLKPGCRIVLVFPDIPQRIAGATVLCKTTQPRQSADPSWTTGPGQFAYLVKLLHYIPEDNSLAIGILGPKSLFKQNKGHIYGNLDGAGFKNTFRIAYSSEGAHPTVWSGPPLVGKRKWHGYFHFNYEVESDATPKDY